MNGTGEWTSRWAARLLVVLAIGALLGRLGPFGTFDQVATGPRYAYWIGLTLLMWLQSVVLLALMERPLEQRGFSRWAIVLLAAIIGAIPTTFEVAWAEMLLRVERDLGPLDLLAIAGDVLLIAIPLLLITHGWPWQLPAGGQRIVESASRAPSAEGVLAISSEDHYVRYYRERGSQLVAKRFGDAILGLVPDQGLQVHRGWWVADSAVERVTRSAGGLSVRLRNGMTVPVSRSYSQLVRKAWADRLE